MFYTSTDDVVIVIAKYLDHDSILSWMLVLTYDLFSDGGLNECVAAIIVAK